MALIQADIRNKDADTAYKIGLNRFEPWKIVLTSFATGGAVVGALVALLSYIHR